MLLNCGVGEDSWESLGLQGDPTSPSERRSVLVVHWKDWCWSWNSNILATWCKELTHLKRPCCWERLKAGREGDDRGFDGWMATPTQWTWVWVNSGSWWWTGRPGMLRFMGSQRVRHDWATELKWTECFQELVNRQWRTMTLGRRENICNELPVYPRFLSCPGIFLTVVRVGWTPAETRSLSLMRQRSELRAAEMAGICVAEIGNKGGECMRSTQMSAGEFWSCLWISRSCTGWKPSRASNLCKELRNELLKKGHRVLGGRAYPIQSEENFLSNSRIQWEVE